MSLIIFNRAACTTVPVEKQPSPLPSFLCVSQESMPQHFHRGNNLKHVSQKWEPVLG